MEGGLGRGQGEKLRDVDAHVACGQEGAAALSHLFHPPYIYIVYLTEVVHSGRHVVHGSWIDGFQLRHDVEPYLVSGILVLEVGVVSHVVLLSGSEEVHYLVAAQAEEGTDDVAIDGLHAAGALDASASDHVEHECLYVVVLVVAYGDGFGMKLCFESSEEVISEFASCHLYAQLMVFGILGSVEVGLVEGYVQFLAEVVDEELVSHALFSAQVEVAVHACQIISHLVEHEREANGVGTAAEADDDSGSWA